jgi:putative glutamine amidotransferase
MPPPVVAITGGYDALPDGVERFRIDSRYFNAVSAAGGVPILLPPVPEEQAVREQLARVDALLISGGADISPARYGRPPHPSETLVHPRREAHDLACAAAALESGLPILALCYGMQLLNIALGGTLIQDLPPAASGAIHHRHAEPDSIHSITIEPGTMLSSILGRTALEVNSSHHQAVDRLGNALRVSARTNDGIVEAVEASDGRFILGVQWHPERLLHRPEQLAIFSRLIDAARKRC